MKIKIELKDIIYLSIILVVITLTQKAFNKGKDGVEERLRETCFLYSKIDTNCKEDTEGFGCEWECTAKASEPDIMYILNK